MELLAGISRPRSHTLSTDGSRIAFFWDLGDRSDLHVMPAGGGWPSRLTYDRLPVAYWTDDPPQWSPDGRWLAYTRAGHVWVVAAGGGMPRKITDFGTGAWAPRWMPDSTGLLISVSRDDHSRILLTDRDGSWPKQITKGPGHDYSPEVSPDGRRMVYVHQPRDDFNRSDIMVADLTAGECRAVTGMPGRHDARPRWSPDGRLVAFISERPGFYQLFVIDPESGQEQQLTQMPHDIGDIAWSPDGRRILCTVNREGVLDLGIVDVASGQFSDLRRSFGVHTHPHWLDDDAVTFEFEDAQNPPDIFRMDITSGEVQQLTFSKTPALAALDLVVPDLVRYPSFDGMEIPAVLYRPRNPNGAAILYPHGGPTSQYVLEFDIVAQYFVAKGYTWLAPNFRGSTGYGLAFERANHDVWGIDDTKDCLAGADYLSSLDWVEQDRIAIFGASYGSYMASTSLAYDPEYRFACGAAKYGDCNILSSWAQGDQVGREDLERMMQHPSKNRAAYRLGSPVWSVEKIKKPLFIAHGLLDDRVHPLQSEEMVEALKRHDKTFEYKTYANEGHGILYRSNRIDFHTRLEQFLDWYLL